MALKFFWVNDNVEPIDSIDVYYAQYPEGPWVKRAELGSTAESYEDDIIPRNTVGYYKVVAVKNGQSSTSWERSFGYYPNGTGPGGSEIVRGDWGFGYMGEVQVSELPNFADIRAAIPGAMSALGGTLSKFHKWSVGNRIIYIPTVPYNEGLSQDSLIPLMIPLNADPATAGIVISKGESVFLWRMPYVSQLFNNVVDPDGTFKITSGTTVTTTDPTFIRSEIAALYASFLNVNGFAKNKYNDLTEGVNSLFLMCNSAMKFGNSFARIALSPLNTPNSYMTYYTSSAGRNIWPVLELLID